MRLRPSEDLAAAFAPVRRPASPDATGTDRSGTRARPYPPLPTSGAVATGRLQLCRRLLSLCSRPTIGTSSHLFCRMLFSGNASCREERPRSVSNDPHPVPGAGHVLVGRQSRTEQRRHFPGVAAPLPRTVSTLSNPHPPAWYSENPSLSA